MSDETNELMIGMICAFTGVTGEVTAHAKNNLATWMLEHPLEAEEEREGASSVASAPTTTVTSTREPSDGGRRWLRPYRGESHARSLGIRHTVCLS